MNLKPSPLRRRRFRGESMQDQSRLANMILSDWRQHNPRMVEELIRADRLTQVLHRVENIVADLLFNYLMVDGMSYQSAWELAYRECLSPESSPP